LSLFLVFNNVVNPSLFMWTAIPPAALHKNAQECTRKLMLAHADKECEETDVQYEGIVHSKYPRKLFLYK